MADETRLPHSVLISFFAIIILSVIGSLFKVSYYLTSSTVI